MNIAMSKTSRYLLMPITILGIICLCVVIGFGLNAFEHSTWNRTNHLNANAALFMENQQYTQAIEVYTEVLALDSANATAEEGLSKAYMELARISDDQSVDVAIEEYQKAIDYDEYNLNAYRELADLYFEQQQLERAFGTLNALNKQYSRMLTGEYLSTRLLRLAW